MEIKNKSLIFYFRNHGDGKRHLLITFIFIRPIAVPVCSWRDVGEAGGSKMEPKAMNFQETESGNIQKQGKRNNICKKLFTNCD